MAGFLGSYRHQLDPKGRVSLPAPYRKGREGKSFVLIQTQPDALSLYPDEAWDEVQAKLREMSERRPELRNQVLLVTAKAVEVIPDKQGRILISEKMRTIVSLETEVMMVGAINHIEIWDPQRFEEMTKLVDHEFDQLIDGVFA
jgi:MraZ protein